MINIIKVTNITICGFNSPGNVRDAIKSNKKAVALDLSEMIGVSWAGGFSGCTALKSVTLPEGVKVIENTAFSHCTSLESITIPMSLTEIERYAFSYCISLRKIVQALPHTE